MTKTSRGTTGNAKSYVGIVDRQWAAPSYDAGDGRASSSLSPDQSGRSPVGSVVGSGSRQMAPSGFYGRDQARTTISTPVRKRPLSQSR